MIVFDIKRYAINDGPGIRTTIFFKGCPLRCVWCHNPESWLREPEWLFKAKKCIGCNTCGVHPHQLEWIRTHHPGSISSSLEQDVCPTLALEVCGREMSLDSLLAEIEKERDVMQDSGGGVTISGGEPLMHVQTEGADSEAANGDLLQLLRALGRQGIHRAVDTTLCAAPEVVRAVAAETDLFLVDLKVMDTGKHRRYTGVGNERILQNVLMLADLGANILFRLPLIEGVNADEENIRQTAAFIRSLQPGGHHNGHPAPQAPATGGQDTADSQTAAPNHSICLLPYHEMGRDKHARRGTVYNPDDIPMHTPSDDTLQHCIRQFAEYGIRATVGG